METKIHSFLMAGQSNMAGRGILSAKTVLDTNNCFMLRMGRWQPLHEPVNPDRPESGASLSSSFAQCYHSSTTSPVGLIPCADGGTSISQWQRGELLFDHAVFQAKLAMRTSELKGILWHQGEYDCLDPQDLLAYPTRFFTVMTSFRQELGDVPILLGELGYPENGFTFTQPDWIHQFNAQLAELASQLPLCAIVSAKGLYCQGDQLHFDTPSLREFGRRYYQKWEELQASV